MATAKATTSNSTINAPAILQKMMSATNPKGVPAMTRATPKAAGQSTCTRWPISSEPLAPQADLDPWPLNTELFTKPKLIAAARIVEAQRHLGMPCPGEHEGT